ncbi:MAG: hypothetical protein AB1512_02915 [Thermodesulfobacteriota bacterium]
MSGSVRVRRRVWTSPEDREFLSFVGGLLYSLRMEQAQVRLSSFTLKRRIPESLASRTPARMLLPAPVAHLVVPSSQSEALKAVAWAAKETGFEPKAKVLPGPSQMLTIEMEQVSDGKVPVYARRVQ